MDYRLSVTRRRFIALAGATAAGLVRGRGAWAAAAGTATSESLMEQAAACKGQGDFAGMAAAIRGALRLGPGNEYAWRSLAWALVRAGEFEESLVVARENLRRHGEGAWPLAQLADSALSVHDPDLTWWVLSRAKARHRFIQGDVVHALRDARKRRLGMFGTKRISVTWTIDPRATWLPDEGGTVLMRLPQLRHPRQDVTYEIVSGAENLGTLQSQDIDYLRVRYDAHAPIVIRTDATVRPGTVPISVLRRTSSRGGPKEVRSRFLGASEDVPILPDGPECQRLIGELRGATAYDTIDNILKWFRDNFHYEDNPTQDSEGLLKEKFGVCHHYSVAICALCRAAGIPARIVGGEVMGWSGEHDRSVVGGGSHGWVEVYLQPIGWVELDGLGHDTFGVIHREVSAYLRFHTVGWPRNPILPNEFSLQGSTTVEARLLELTPDRPL
ncbi:MAG: transglutaminase domain-containing protein [Armatimonadetes bacterium]|nr:transglutaminase domain-containing protein [Armatimonadota bacterium]